MSDLSSTVVAILDRTVWLQNGCRVWTGAHDQKGYGQIRRNKKSYRVHRVIYAATHGKIPEGMLVCHRCDNPPCVRKKHLFLGTAKDNTADMCRKKRYAGRFRKGMKDTNRKFSVRTIRYIRKAYASGKVTQVELAKKYRTRQGHISNIVTGRSWYNLCA